ncbi:MAG: glutathione S-transferase [Rhodospirillaceae bacterium]|jgi:glutathione S-transferase|nr:glutathione S-transferase [Rhodospirillaceae bacterium]MBT4044783.1 glutathione S-transferase [Rhodospirillaceae bacterium]MBT4688441.1 glutathione S-transferase [Rhodospirillaceae bacterium]MBT5079744.1 glutathione S-transferase [Rhodospirillaceae bacterium]MBT5526318.1 glutathione S-transferase [Rhodospirillaceae bacterium]
MQLFWTPASPFTRKVSITAMELGLWERIEIRPTTWPLDWGYATVPFTEGLAEANPVAQIPTLVTDDGVSLGNSTLICQYLNEQARGASGAMVIPNDDTKWAVWSLYAIADGILEAQVGMRAEQLRPDDLVSGGYLQKQRDRIERCFDAMEARADELTITDAAIPNLAQITAAIACGYQDWREWLGDFRPGRPGLAAWYETISQRPSFRDTEPDHTPEG